MGSMSSSNSGLPSESILNFIVYQLLNCTHTLFRAQYNPKFYLPKADHYSEYRFIMSGITENTATQAHDLVEQAETEEQQVSYSIQ